MTIDIGQSASPFNGQSIQENRADRLIYLVDDDAVQARVLASQIGYFGYGVRIFHTLADLKDVVRKTTPDALLMDITFPEGKMAGTDVITEMRRTYLADTPVMFISINDEPLCRLQAVRAGGQAYFTKPVDVAGLIDALDRQFFQGVHEPYRVLIVDDSYVQANVNAMYLKQAGMHPVIVTDPLQVLNVMKDCNPELILMDVYMPDCSGMELARMIRQIEAYLCIPIVYLSSETDRDLQLQAVGHGGDDFLVKPIKPAHLVASVSSRIERYRGLSTLMLRDGLTGLFNHTTTKERLIQEVARAERQNAHVSFAIIDMDRFKRVNDTYGHPAGDRVLKSLAHLLVRRLRGSDIVGRYGGEEFAVILPNTTATQAVSLMDELRASFEKIRHRASGVEFSATFSCGVASFPPCQTPAALAEAADRALYAAKENERNRVCLQ
jgi:diguanylate cyclase (GGDEF)-like protein